MSNQTNNKLSIERIEQYANDKRMCNVNDEILEMAHRLLSAEAELQEYRKAMPAHEATDFQVSDAIAHMENEADMVLVPRGLLGAAAGAIRHPRHEAGVTLGSLRHYSHRKPITPQSAPPLQAVPDAYMRDEQGRMMLNGKSEPRIGYADGWNACRAAMLAPPQQ